MKYKVEIWFKPNNDIGLSHKVYECDGCCTEGSYILLTTGKKTTAINNSIVEYAICEEQSEEE